MFWELKGKELALESLEKEVALLWDSLEKELENRRNLVALETKHALMEVTSGARSGRVYSLGSGTYRASASGEAPAVRTGAWQKSYELHSRGGTSGGKLYAGSGVQSDLKVGGYYLSDLLEFGTSNMDSRPFVADVVARVYPEAERIYREDYLL